MTDEAGDAGPAGLVVAAPADLDWRRPHPYTVVLEIGRALRQVAIALIAVQGDLFGGSSVVEIAVVALPLAAALARWYTTRYAVDVESLHHHHGLLWRKRQVLPRSNIQNVTTRAGVVARLGSVVELQVSDASATGDVSVRYIDADEAERLSTLLRTASGAPTTSSTPTAGGDGQPNGTGADGPAGAAPPAGPPSQTAPLVEPPLRDLIRFEASANPTLMTGVIGLVGMVVGLVTFATDPLAGSDVAELRWLLLAAAVVLPIGLMVTQVASRVLQIGGFRLVADPDRLRIQVGLLTESRITARRERLQQIRVVRQLLHRRLGWERVEFETADVEASDNIATSYLAPTGLTGGWVALAVEAFGRVDLGEDDLRPVSPLTRRRILVRFALAAVALALPSLLLSPWLAPAVAAAIMVPGWWYSSRRFEALGWAVADDQLLTRSGVATRALTLVRVSKIQVLRCRSSYFQRRLGLSTVQLSTAGRGSQGLVTLPDLPTETALVLLDQLARRSAATPIADTL